MKHISIISLIIILTSISIIITGCDTKTSPPAEPNNSQTSPESDNTENQANPPQENTPPQQTQDTQPQPQPEQQENQQPDQNTKENNTPEQEVSETGEPMEALNLKNVPLDQVVAILAEWTGKVVIPTDSAMKQKITVYSAGKLPRSEALRNIYTALRAKGFIAEHTDDVIYIKPISEARIGSVPTITAEMSLDDIDDKNQVVEKFFKIKHYSPTKLQEIIAPLVAEYGHLTADDMTSTIAVVDTVDNLLRVQRVISQLDVPESAVMTTRVFPIEYGDPGEIVDILRQLSRDYTRGRGYGKVHTGKSRSQSGPASSVVVDVGTTPIVFIPDLKRRWIIVKASSADMTRIAEWIEKLDVKATTQPEKLDLKNAPMEQVVELMAEWTGKTIIPSDRLLRERITLYSAQKLTRTEAMDKLYAALQSRGYVPEHVGDVIYLKPIHEVKIGSIPTLKPEDNLEDIKDKNQIIEKFFAVKYYPVSRLQEIIAPLIANYGHLTADESTKTISIIDTVENLIRVQRIIDQLDVKESVVISTRVFELQYADPTEIVSMIRQLFYDRWGRRYDRSRKQSRAYQRRWSRAASTVVVDIGDMPIVLIPDQNRRWVIAKAHSSDMEVIDEWITKLDIKQSDQAQKLNLRDVPADKIVELIANWTGKTVIPSGRLDRERISVFSSEQLNRAQALEKVYSALRVHGYIAEHTDDVIYIKPIREAKIGSVPTVPPEKSLDEFQDNTQIVEKFFKLKHYSPMKLQEIISPLIADYGHITAEETTGTISVIDTVENLRRIQRIINQLDVEKSVISTQVFEIQYGDPGEIVQVLNMLYHEKRQWSYRYHRGYSRRGYSRNRAQSVVIDAENAPIVLIPDIKHNWIIAKAGSEDIQEIGEMIKQLDKEETKSAKQTVVAVNYVDAREVARIVNDTLRRMPNQSLRVSIVVQPLPETKQIVIFGSDENREMVQKLIAEIDVPETGVLETKHFKMQHADPDEMKTRIEEMFDVQQQTRNYYSRYRRRQQENADTIKVFSYNTLRQVTVIASPENLREIAKRIKEWDVPPAIKDNQYMLVSLRNSDPQKMADLLRRMFTDEGSGGRNWWQYWFGIEDSKEKIVGSLYGMLSFEAVPDTKKIIVMSQIPEAYPIIKELIEDLDHEENAELPMVITLKYAEAESLCEQLNGILNETGTLAPIPRSRSGLTDYSIEEDQAAASGSKAQAIETVKQTDMMTPWWNRAPRERDKMPTSNLIGKIRFVPVHRSKAILVLSPPEYQNEIRDIVKQLDKPGKQVMVKAIILEINHDDVTTLGLQLSSNPTAFGDLSENAIRALNALTRLETRGSTTLESSVNINGLVDFLLKKTNASIINEPTLWTKDNEEAVFFKGRKVAFVENVNTSTEGTRTSETVEYRKVGVILQVRPNITPEKAVDMSISLEISQVEPELINDRIAISQLDTATRLIVDDGETIMLGGILYQTDSNIERKLPILGDLPLLGPVFRHYDNKIQNNELLAFITPYVVDEQTSKEAQQQLREPIMKLRSIAEQMKHRFEQENLFPEDSIYRQTEEPDPVYPGGIDPNTIDKWLKENR